MSSHSRGFQFTINCWQFIVVHYLVPGPTPCPEVVAVSYIRLAEVPTLFSVEGDAQVEQKNTAVRFLTQKVLLTSVTVRRLRCIHFTLWFIKVIFYKLYSIKTLTFGYIYSLNHLRVELQRKRQKAIETQFL